MKASSLPLKGPYLVPTKNSLQRHLGSTAEQRSGRQEVKQKAKGERVLICICIRLAMLSCSDVVGRKDGKVELSCIGNSACGQLTLANRGGGLYMSYASRVQTGCSSLIAGTPL